MTTPTNLRSIEARRPLFTAADLAAELDPTPETIVRLAQLDVEADLRTIQAGLGDLAEPVARRLIATRAHWRHKVIASEAGALDLAGEYERLLIELEIELGPVEPFEPYGPTPKTKTKTKPRKR